jgi:hypothetical protein
MSPLAKLYLIACWSYIISFHLTLCILTLDMSASAPMAERVLEYETLD